MSIEYSSGNKIHPEIKIRFFHMVCWVIGGRNLSIG